MPAVSHQLDSRQQIADRLFIAPVPDRSHKCTARNTAPIASIDIPRQLGRSHHQYTRVPINTLLDAVSMGRGKYRAIICIAWMSLYWDGWKPKKKSKRIKTEKVLFTRRMMKNQFGYSEDLFRRALVDLKLFKMISVDTPGFYKKDKNSGTYYKLAWMPGKGSNRINLYWGLMASDAFLSLSVTLQAVLLMLHTIHYRKQNKVVITPTSLKSFSVSRKKLPGYMDKLRQAGFIDLIDTNTYSFTWLDGKGKPDFDNWNVKSNTCEIKNSVPNCTQACP